MHIKRLGIENFQSHKHTVLDLHPGFNCLVGTGNSGKSSIARALAFILFGQWDSSWVRKGEKFCRISIITDSGTEVIREKGGKLNKYRLLVPGQPEQIYENFGIHIPQEIVKVLKTFKVQVDSNDYINLNLSSQLDPLFLLSKSGSFKAKVIGKLSGGHYLDHALREINSDKKSMSANRKMLDIESKDLQEELKQYEELEEQINLVSIIGYKIESAKKLEQEIEKLKWLNNRHKELEEKYAVEQDTCKSLKDIPTYNTWNNILSEKLQELGFLTTLSENLKSNRVEKIQLHTNRTSLDIKVKEHLGEYFSVLKENKVCPTCFEKIDDEILGRIGKEIENG